MSMETVELVALTSGASGVGSGTIYPVSPGYVSLENAKSVRSLVTIQVDQGTNFDIEVEGAAESGGPWHPIVNLTQAGAIDLSDGSATASYAEIPGLFPFVRVNFTSTTSTTLYLYLRK